MSAIIKQQEGDKEICAFQSWENEIDTTSSVVATTTIHGYTPLS